MKIIPLFSLCLLSLICCCAYTPKYAPGSSWRKNGITSLETIRVNGLRHEVLIRGTDRRNPLVIFIHGLGIPSMCFAHEEYAQSGAPLETLCTVVHYDQRGFGKTYIHGKRRVKYLTVDQYVRDAETIVDTMRRRFGQERVYLVAESWGCVIAMHLVKKRPEWFNALFALGENNDVKQYLDDLYHWCMENAQQEKNAVAIDKLRKYGCPSTDLARGDAFRAYRNIAEWIYYYEEKRYGSDSGQAIFFKALWDAPEYHVYDFLHTITAYLKTQKKLLRQLLLVDMEADVPSVEVPVYMIMGERDFWLPNTKRYFDALESPVKEWFVIKDAGHIVRGDRPEEVEKIIFEKIGNNK